MDYANLNQLLSKSEIGILKKEEARVNNYSKENVLLPHLEDSFTMTMRRDIVRLHNTLGNSLVTTYSPIADDLPHYQNYAK